MIPVQYGYLVGDAVAMFIWLALFIWRKDVRREMIVMGVLIGCMSMATSYYWWTHDWWHPATITGTRIGIEDLLSGFFTGGIMAVIYEALFRKQAYRSKNAAPAVSALTFLLLLALATSWLFWGVGLTSFWASSAALLGAAVLLFYLRKDLFINSVASGALMTLVSLPIYYAIILLAPGWIAATYDTPMLSGVTITGIPIEEIVFWFLAGLVFGPFYEYWHGQRMRARARK